METLNITALLEKHDLTTEVEVLIGLKENVSEKKLELYCGDDGTVLNDAGFNIYRVRLTVECLRDLKVGGDQFVEYIEPAAHETDLSWDTEYDQQYETN